MKKRPIIFSTFIIISIAIALSLVSWNKTSIPLYKSTFSAPAIDMQAVTSSFIELNELDLLYKIDSRFINRITKEQLLEAKSIFDIFPPHEKRAIDLYKNVKVSILNDGGEIIEEGVTETFNQKQLDLLQSMDYSANFYVKAVFQQQNILQGQVYEDYIVYYTTLIPETEAEYQFGQKSLIEYLKETTKEAASVITRDKLQPGKVDFTITADGSIDKVNLSSTSGYPEVDKKLLEAINNIPGTWMPAKNGKGQAVNQELVFFFGLEGC